MAADLFYSASWINPILARIPDRSKSAVSFLVSIEFLSTFSSIYFLLNASSILAF